MELLHNIECSREELRECSESLSEESRRLQLGAKLRNPQPKEVGHTRRGNCDHPHTPELVGHATLLHSPWQ